MPNRNTMQATYVTVSFLVASFFLKKKESVHYSNTLCNPTHSNDHSDAYAVEKRMLMG